VEDLNDENRAKEFLLWFEKAVIKHKEVVNVVMLDLGLKADLLQLYHHIFEAQCHSSLSTRAETFQLFTKIMIHLLETQGHLPQCHQAVVSACMPEASHDQSTHGKTPTTYSVSPFLLVLIIIPNIQLFTFPLQTLTDLFYLVVSLTDWLF